MTYADGTSGEIDLSREVGKGVFSALRDTRFFETARIGSNGQIQWTEDLEICPEAAYQEFKESDVGISCLRSVDSTELLFEFITATNPPAFASPWPNDSQSV